MRRSALLLGFTLLAIPAWASTPVTVSELNQKLAAGRGKADAEIAQQLSSLELTERMSTSALTQVEKNSPGPKTTQELEILADRSAYLDPPASEIPNLPSPDAATQRQIMKLVVNYVTTSVHRLPDFRATRETISFRDRPAGLFTELPLHSVGQVAETVIYQNGKEVGTTAKGKKAEPPPGLVSWGEFGPILSIVLLDAAQNQLAWSRWEEAAGGRRAVFHYAVPSKKSHYDVRFCCRYLGDDQKNHFSAYRGEIAVDPATGTILRVTVIAELHPSDDDAGAVVTASMAVEYGEVEIAGVKYVCPVKSVALAQRRENDATVGPIAAQAAAHAPLITMLNQVDFSQYHLFRGDTRVLSESEAESLQAAPAPNQSTNAAQPEEAAIAPETTAPVEEPAKVSGEGTADAQQRVAPPATAMKTNEPALQADNGAPEQTPVFKTAARDVVVDVVVTKGNGDPVPGLSKQDFTVSENGKPQKVDFFEDHSAAAKQQNAPPEMPKMPEGMHTNVPSAPPTDAVNVLLIDTLNTGLQDQAFVRKSVLEFLGKMQPGTRMAIFALGSKLRCIQGFTTDTSVLLAALRDPRNGFSGQKSSYLQTRSDQAGDAGAVSALQAMRASSVAIETLQAAVADTGAKDFGARASMTFQALMYLGHYLAGVPGRKNLIWFAGSFPIMVFPTPEQLARMKHSPNDANDLDRVKVTADLFTVSQIAVYPISAEGLASDNSGSADSAGPGAGGAGGPGHGGNSAGNSVTSPYMNAGFDRANTNYAMNQLADSTGGKAFYNSNDLNAAMHRAVSDGANYYTIGYSPTNAATDGSYRQIDVKLAHGKFKLAYRHGYNADAGPAAQPSVDPLPSLLQLGLPAATGVLYGMRAERSAAQPATGATHVGQNPNVKDPVVRYTVDFVVRVQDLIAQTSPKGQRSVKFLLGLKAYDRDGNALNWEGDVEAVEINRDRYESVRREGLPAHVEIDLPAATGFTLVTAVYDLDSDVAGTLQLPVEVDTENAKAH